MAAQCRGNAVCVLSVCVCARGVPVRQIGVEDLGGMYMWMFPGAMFYFATWEECVQKRVHNQCTCVGAPFVRLGAGAMIRCGLCCGCCVLGRECAGFTLMH